MSQVRWRARARARIRLAWCPACVSRGSPPPGSHHHRAGARERGDFDEAIRYAQKAVTAGGGNPARMILGHSYMRKAEPREALRYYQAVLASNPNHREAKQSAEEAMRRIDRQ